MPSPIGHAIAGAAVAWGGDALAPLSTNRASSTRLVATCAALAAVADLDLIIPRYHRSYSHSVIAVLLVFIVAARVTGEVQRRWRTAILCAAAYASHLVLDWLGADTLPPFGLQALWPFSTHFFISGFGVFAEVERRHPFALATIAQNLRAAAQEVAVVAPLAFALWAVRGEVLARRAPDVQDVEKA